MEHDEFLFDSKKYFLTFPIRAKKDQIGQKGTKKGQRRDKNDEKEPKGTKGTIKDEKMDHKRPKRTKD